MAERAGAPQDNKWAPDTAWFQDVTRIDEIDVLWITAGLGCDGDTIAITAATQPSIEDIVLGGLPGIPKVDFRNPVMAAGTCAT
jgi:hydrogenase small subunit